VSRRRASGQARRFNPRLTGFAQLVFSGARAPIGRGDSLRDDFDAIPPKADQAEAGSVLTRIYHDIGLAAVAGALRLAAADFDPEMRESLERGEFYLLPFDPALAAVGLVA
jgi:hypothetical protein